MTFLRASLLAAAVAATSLTQLAGCGCTLVGCESGVTTTLLLAPDAPLDGAEVTICVNDECVGGVVTADQDQLSCEFAGGTGHFCAIDVSDPAQIVMEVHVFVFEDDAEDGDLVSVTVSSGEDGTNVLAQRQGTVEYEESEPNGAMCGPTCKNATL